MATNTDFPHRKSLRETREAGWALAKAGKTREGMKYLRQARAMEDAESRRIEALKQSADAKAGAKRRDNDVLVEDAPMYRRDL